MYPDSFSYSKDHEWVHVEGDIGTIGITDFAQKQLGDVVYVELPEVGTKLEYHQSFGVIESIKAVSDVYAPVSGEVTAVNEELNDAPELLNESPHNKGWIIKIKVKSGTELEKLMPVNEYEKYLEGLED
ncbi:MAG: glycine cleavage system protein GcvH [Candidatus Aminicenantes bacterium]|nr:glycine cleavage system protein GcvH [Candidatus Aminicenantes bacterium]